MEISMKLWDQIFIPMIQVIYSIIQGLSIQGQYITWDQLFTFYMEQLIPSFQYKSIPRLTNRYNQTWDKSNSKFYLEIIILIPCTKHEYYLLLILFSLTLLISLNHQYLSDYYVLRSFNGQGNIFLDSHHIVISNFYL